MSFSKVFFHSLDESWRHVTADILHFIGISTMGLKILLEGVHCGNILAFCGIDYPGFIQINKDTYVVVASYAGSFINTNIDNITEIFLLSSLFYVVLDNPLYPCIMFSYQIGKDIDRHGFGKFNDKRFKQHGKS
ncbi:MAG: hypothetical protein PWQ82_1881 [Thermosediminibacterales bacterium]|nr:hypothetical protein [Thermosediminibacterales bacterium]MDK2836917.1 hypothetical protein [Thermosediminibacterales bacterium]